MKVKYEIYYNGKKVNMKWVKENYGEMYAESLMNDIKNADAEHYESIEDGELEIFTWVD